MGEPIPYYTARDEGEAQLAQRLLQNRGRCGEYKTIFNRPRVCRSWPEDCDKGHSWYGLDVAAETDRPAPEPSGLEPPGMVPND